LKQVAVRLLFMNMPHVHGLPTGTHSRRPAQAGHAYPYRLGIMRVY